MCVCVCVCVCVCLCFKYIYVYSIHADSVIIIFFVLDGYIWLQIYGTSKVSLIAIPGEFYSLECRVFGAADLYDEIIFTRNTTQSTFASVSQKGDTCSIYTRPPADRYRLQCAIGTDQSAADPKIYTLATNRIVEDDITDWTCHLSKHAKFSNVFAVVSHSKWFI